MKTLAQTFIALLIVFLVGWITISENNNKALRSDKKHLESALKEKQDSLQFYYDIHLAAIELNNIVDNNRSTKRVKLKSELIRNLNY